MSDNTKDNIVPFVSAAEPHIRKVWASVSGLCEATLKILSSAYYSFSGFLMKYGHDSSTYISEGGSVLLTSLSAIFLNVSDIVRTWFWWTLAATTEGGVFIFEKISGGLANVAHFFWIFNNHTEYYADSLEVSHLTGAETLKKEPEIKESRQDVKYVDKSSYIEGILQRIADLEARLQVEKSRRLEEEEKLEAALKNYHMILQVSI